MATGEIDSSSTAPSEPVTREALYAFVWSEPMLKVAARYSVSSSYMARVCTLLNVPRPERGYWAKLAVGKAKPKPPLPDARPGDELVWSRDGQHIKETRLPPQPPSTAIKKRTKPATPRPSQHTLILGAKAHFESGRDPHEAGYLKPFKFNLVDLAVTKTSLDKALSFANELFLSLEDNGYRVVLAPNKENFYRASVDIHEVPAKKQDYNNFWHPWRRTVAYIGTVAIGLTIIEMAEEVEVRYVNGEYIREKDYVPPKRSRYEYDHSWTTKKDFPTGRLCLQAYSPYSGTNWVNRWRETKNHELDSQIKRIVKELEQAAVIIAQQAEEANRLAEIRRQEWAAEQEQWRREEEARRAAQALKDSREHLQRIIHAWAEANRIEQFFMDAERRADGLDENERLKLLERLKLARGMVGSTDALDHFLAWKSPDER